MPDPKPTTTEAPPLPDGLLDRLRETLGPRGVVTDAEALAPYLSEWRNRYQGRSAAVLRPASTAETADAVRLCAESGVAITPQGGNTGLVGGAVAEGGVIVSTERLNRIRSVDADTFSMTVEAGCILADVQAAAAEAGRLFPLSLGAEGTCRIGGNLSTNAGGIHVLRYGNARDLVLGLEVVLPDGRVWDGLRALRKDNTGYALKHLFLGAEGTLGIITAAVLRLFPRPAARETALCALPDAAAAIRLFGRCMDAAGDVLNAFECSNRTGVHLAETLVEGVTVPLSTPSPFYALIEFAATGADDGGLRARFEAVLADAMEAGLVTDAVLAETEAQTAGLWRIREGITEAQIPAGLCAKHDVSVPISQIPTFLERAEAEVRAVDPDIRLVAYGHFGDGNIHFNAVRPETVTDEAFRPRIPPIQRAVHDVTMALNGSFSAEHGVGLMKRGDVARYRSAVEVDLMRAVKRAVDPKNLMNPGKVLPPE
jgi:FAD/FMN-containing dehydrogenase